MDIKNSLCKSSVQRGQTPKKEMIELASFWVFTPRAKRASTTSPCPISLAQWRIMEERAAACPSEMRTFKSVFGFLMSLTACLRSPTSQQRFKEAPSCSFLQQETLRETSFSLTSLTRPLTCFSSTFSPEEPKRNNALSLPITK